MKKSQYEYNQGLEKWYLENLNPRKIESQLRLGAFDPSTYKEGSNGYKIDWALYEKACSREKLMFFRILKDAVDFLMVDYEYKGNGRPPVYLADIVKSLCIRMFSQYSSWRSESELRISKSLGIIDEVYKRSTLNKYLQSKKVTKLLDKLYKIIAEPLCEVEVYFAADASGISNKYGNVHWMKIRHTKEEFKHKKDFSKLNIITGIRTNVVTSAKITPGNTHESPYFKSLLDDTAKIFTIKELSADAGYLSKENVKAIADVGAMPFIKSKRNVHVPQRGIKTPWAMMLRMWKNHQMFFARHYNRRQNVEATFSMIKKRFGDFCRSKKPQSQQNEILAKVCCHNAVCLAEALLSYDLKKGFMAGL